MPPIVVLNQTRGITLTPYYHPTSLHLRQSGAAAIMSADFRVTDLSPAGNVVVLEPEDLIKITDGGSTAFRGPIRNRNRTDTGLGPTPKRSWKITCQDMTSVLTDVVIDDPDTGIRPEETDRERIQALVAAYPILGLTAPTATVGNLQVSDLPAASYMGLSLYEAFEQIARLLSPNAQFYVDFEEPPRVHWFHAETENAPFQLSNTPNETTTFGYDNLEMPDDTFELVNAVYAMGGAGTTPVWIDDGTKGISNANAVTSIGLYGRREGSYVDPEQTSQATLQALAAAMIGRLAFPKGPKKLTVYRPGLRAGMQIQLTNTLWGISGVSYPIAQLDAKPIVSDNQLRYDLVLDDVKPSLAGEVGRTDSAVTSAISAAAQALEQAPDAVAPSTPAGLSLSSGYDIAVDGTVRTYIDAEWTPNSEFDLQAYELQLDEANRAEVTFTTAVIASGGTMPAGTYSVQVTALGPHGETRGKTPPQEVVIASGQRLGVTITAYPNATGYRIFASRTEVPLFVQSTTTTGSQVAIDAEGSGVPAPLTSTFVDFANPATFRTALERVHVEDVLGGTYYAARVRALDDWNNRSAYSGAVGITTARDIEAPEIPGGLAAIPGFRLVGLNWQRSTAIDFDRYEVRWTYDLAGAPDPAQWTKLTSRSSVLVVADLAPDVVHWFEVRAIDRSNNVQTSALDPTAVDADANGEAGWSEPVAATPTLVGAADVAFNSVLTYILNANQINADDINAGTVSIGGLADTPDFLLVYNTTGQEIGRWDQNGLVIRDPNNTSRVVRLVDGVLSFSTDGGTTWTTAISADGIVADAIKLGAAPGGHNAVPNASFELSAFATYFSKVWTVTTDWDDGTSQVGVSVAGADLTLSSVTY
jgi:hypothetical protein